MKVEKLQPNIVKSLSDTGLAVVVSIQLFCVVFLVMPVALSVALAGSIMRTVHKNESDD